MRTALITKLLLITSSVVAQVNLQTERPVHLVKEMSSTANTTKTLKKGEAIRLIDFNKGFYTVVHQSDTLYAYYPYIQETAEVAKFKTIMADYHAKNVEAKRKEAKEKQAQKEFDNFVAKVKEYSDRFGEKYAYKIAKKEIEIGMSAAMVTESIGHPEKKNVTKSASYNHEQWVYKDKYLYFEEGVLTTIQETN